MMQSCVVPTSLDMSDMSSMCFVVFKRRPLGSLDISGVFCMFCMSL